MSELTKEEKEIEAAVLAGHYKPVPESKWRKYKNAARVTIKKMDRINTP